MREPTRAQRAPRPTLLMHLITISAHLRARSQDKNSSATQKEHRHDDEEVEEVDEKELI